MSRYLEMTVDGTPDRVGERALRAFRRVGRLENYDQAKSLITGVIKMGGEPAYMKVTWRAEDDTRSRLEIAGSSDDVLSRAADSALYSYARSYKAVGWPNPEKERLERQERGMRLLLRGALLIGAVAVGFGINYFLNR